MAFLRGKVFFSTQSLPWGHCKAKGWHSKTRLSTTRGRTVMMGWVRRRQMAPRPLSSSTGSRAAAAPQSGAHSHGGRAPTPNQAGPRSPLRVAAILCLPCHPLSSAAAPAMAACLLLPGNKPTGRKTLRKTPRKTPQHSSPRHTPSLLLPHLLPCCLPARSRRLPWLGPPSLPTSLKHGRVGGMLNFGEPVPAGWLKHVPHGGFLTPKPRGCC